MIIDNHHNPLLVGCYVYILTIQFPLKEYSDFFIVYWKIQVDRMGFEPMASCLQSRRSSADLPAHTTQQ